MAVRLARATAGAVQLPDGSLGLSDECEMIGRMTDAYESRPIGIDLFAGAGGMSLGFEQAGFDIRAAIEFDPIHCATHAFNFPQTAVICEDLSHVSAESIRELTGSRDVDVVFGGPPCQGFSFMGKRLVDDPRNSLVGHFIRIVAELRPRYFVLENVPGMKSGAHRAVLDEAVRELEAAGYCVTQPIRILDAADFGVPQNRRRLFLIGSRADQTLVDYPAPTTPVDALRVTVWDAISDLPDADRFEELLSSDEALGVELGAAGAYAARLRGLKIDEQDFSIPRRQAVVGITSSMRTVHTQQSIQRFRDTPPGSIEPISRFLRLAPEGRCNTLRAGTAADRGAYTSPRPIHPVNDRCITVREAARLHSYPDWFRFHATKWHGFRQVGNSVPPLLARAIGQAVMNALGETPIKSTTILDLGDASALRWTMSEAALHFGVRGRTIHRTRDRGST